MTIFHELLSKKRFGPTAKINALLDKQNPSDKDLAKAVLSTKAYKEDPEVKKQADAILAGKAPEPIKEAPKSSSTRSGERYC